MLRTLACCALLALVAAPASAEKAKPSGDKQLSGMSIVGDHETPKALAIVPWKSSDLGDRLAVSRMLDDGYQPVDRDVFMRELDYYQIGAEARGITPGRTR